MRIYLCSRKQTTTLITTKWLVTTANCTIKIRLSNKQTAQSKYGFQTITAFNSTSAKCLLHSSSTDSSEIGKKMQQKNHSVEWFFCLETGIDLSSRAVSSQVLLAQVSLTSVFGMGTGGTSPLQTPVMVEY